MKKIVMIIVILSAVVLAGTAQNYTTAHLNDPAIQSHQILQTGAAYEGTVYEPFSNTTPSEQSYSPAKAPGHVRRAFDENGNWVPDSEDFGGGAEYGGAENEFPLGDAVLPLLLCAVVFGFVIGSRKKRA